MQINPEISCARAFYFDAAHRVVGHEGKCRNLHGHRYRVEAHFTSQKLDHLGMVVDFGVLRERLGKWVADHWDHAVILFDKDGELGEAIASVTDQNIYYLPYNPTAENLCRYLAEKIVPTLFAELEIRCVKLILSESPETSCQIIL